MKYGDYRDNYYLVCSQAIRFRGDSTAGELSHEVLFTLDSQHQAETLAELLGKSQAGFSPLRIVKANEVVKAYDFT